MQYRCKKVLEISESLIPLKRYAHEEAIPVVGVQPFSKLSGAGWPARISRPVRWGYAAWDLGQISARLDLTSSKALVMYGDGAEIRIEYRKIESIEYGQNVSRRYAAAILLSPMLLSSKSRKHFVTLGYTDEEGKQQAIVFRVEKGDIRSDLASLEARTGRRVEYQDDEARKGNR